MDAGPLRPSSPRWRQPTATGTPKAERAGELPSLEFLESTRMKSEAPEFDAKQNGVGTTITTAPAPAPASPRMTYSGPPPPYSYPSSTAGVSLGIAGYASPPDSRRTSDDDKENNQARSLPSIHEALGKDHGSLYSAAPPSVSHLAQTPHATSLSPTTPVPRSHPEPTLAGPPNPYAASQSLPPYTSEPVERRLQTTPRQGSQSDEVAYAARRMSGHESGPLSAQTNGSTSSPITQVRQSPHLMHPQQHPAQVFPPASQPASLQAPGYRPAAPGYHFPPPPPPPPPAATFPTHQPPLPHQIYWRPEGPGVDRVDEMRKAATKQSSGGPQHYGESVKRHLEIFELETSLNEIAEGCGRGLEFSRVHGNRAHQSQRTGLNIESMPTVAECDRLIQDQQRVLDSMNRIKELIIAQQHALAEQRSRQEASKPHHGEYRDDPSMYGKDVDGVGGFNGADNKRRRGRNAPPGRCHSCNRAETPEWRRGPDGARTLCNACGLHYAKLTRKMGTKATIGSSNLRPKENGSP